MPTTSPAHLSAAYKLLLRSQPDIERRAAIFDYDDEGDFARLWSSDNNDRPMVLREIGRKEAIIIVWDGSFAQTGDPRMKVLAPHLTPVDWSLATSIRIAADASLLEHAHFAIHVITLTSAAPTNSWAIHMRHQLCAQMPWLRLHAPFIPLTGTVNDDGRPDAFSYRDGFQSIIDNGDPLALLKQDANQWRLNSNTKKLSAALREMPSDLDRLPTQWAASLSRGDDHHDINNIVGPYILLGSVGYKQIVDDIWVRAFMARMSWLNAISHSSAQLQDPLQLSRPTSLQDCGRMHVLCVDDQLNHGWNAVLAQLFGATPVGPHSGPRTFFAQCDRDNWCHFATRSSPTIHLYGSTSPKIIAEVLSRASFDRRDFAVRFKSDTDGAPELLVLDLRLQAASQGDQQSWNQYLKLLTATVERTWQFDEQLLAWPGISKLELQAAQRGWNGSPQINDTLQALTILPRLIALASPCTPILIFSSTARADIKATLSKYKNVFLQFQKPDAFADRDVLQSRFDALGEDLTRALAYLPLQRVLRRMERDSRPIRSGADLDIQYFKSKLNRVRRIEVFVDESGDFHKDNDINLLSSFVLLHANKDSALALNDSLHSAATATRAGQAAPLWQTILNGGQTSLPKGSDLANQCKVSGKIVVAQYIKSMTDYVTTVLAPVVTRHVECEGLSCHVERPPTSREPADAEDAQYSDRRWYQCLALNIEFLLFVVLPWLVPAKKDEQRMEVGLFVDRRSIPFAQKDAAAAFAESWQLDDPRFRPDPGKWFVTPVTQGSLWPFVRELSIRWQDTKAMDNLHLYFEEGITQGLSGDPQPPSGQRRSIHWLADWIAHATRTIFRRSDRTATIERIFAPIIKRTHFLTFDGDTSRMLEATRMAALGQYTESLFLLMETVIGQTAATWATGSIRYVAATLIDALVSAPGDQFWLAVNRAALTRDTSHSEWPWNIRCSESERILKIGSRVSASDLPGEAGRHYQILQDHDDRVIALIEDLFVPAGSEFVKVTLSKSTKTYWVQPNAYGISEGPYPLMTFDAFIERPTTFDNHSDALPIDSLSTQSPSQADDALSGGANGDLPPNPKTTQSPFYGIVRGQGRFPPPKGWWLSNSGGNGRDVFLLDAELSLGLKPGDRILVEQTDHSGRVDGKHVSYVSKK